MGKQIAMDLGVPASPAGAPSRLYDCIPEGLTPTQRERCEHRLDRMACMNVQWFADRAFTCPDSLPGTIEGYKSLVVLTAHEGA